MYKKQFSLLNKRRFLPLFITQFLEAFNDNAYKLAMLTMIAYQLGSSATETGHYQALGAALFILPYFLFSATAGELADKYNKAKLMRYIKLVEVFCMIIGSVALIWHHIPLMMATLFGMGAHAAFFSPNKYAILPEQLEEDELISGNALIEASTFVAILLGTIVGTLCGGSTNPWLGVYLMSSILIGLALAGWWSSLYIPDTKPQAPNLKIKINFIKSTFDIVYQCYQKSRIYLLILGISWFWFIGATFLTQLPVYTKYILGYQSTVFGLFLTLFSLGIVISSLTVNRLLGGHLTTKYVPLAMLGLSIFSFDLYLASPIEQYIDELQPIQTFLLEWHNYRILFDIFMLAFSGGVFIVPLYALLQAESDAQIRSRVIAANNVLNALFMVGSAVLIAMLNAIGIGIVEVFAVTALINLVGVFYACLLLPEAIIKTLVNGALRFLYKARVKGLENYYQAGDKVVIIANHTSFLDIILLSAFLPDKFLVAVNTHIAKEWWVRPFLPLVDAFPIDSTNPMAAKSMIRLIKNGKKCIIFPEGRLTTTGTLMKVYEGAAMIADKSGAKLLPIRIDGAVYTPFTRLKGKVRIRLFPKITLTFLPAQPLNVPATETRRGRRQFIAMHLYRLMTEMMFTSSPYQRSIIEALLEAKHIHGAKKLIIEDIKRKPLSYRSFVTKSFVLGQKLAKLTYDEETVGLMLPTGAAAAVSFFAFQIARKVPAMINFSMGPQTVLSTLRTAQVTTVVTAKQFVVLAKLEKLIDTLTAAGINIIYLDEIKIGLPTKLSGLARAKTAKFTYRPQKPHDQAVILFTSGSEGAPKAVVLSQQNILSNCYQMAARIDFNGRDIAFNALPIFHCFGLTVGTVLPLISGIRVFCYPSPLHYRIVPELVYDTDATIMFGTNTFLKGYAKYAHPYDFYSIRYVFAGAEKLTSQVRNLYAERFGVRVFEGYGATETAPVLSSNTPMQHKEETTGCLMPGIEHQLVKVEGIEEGGRLLVKGPNVMLGYMLSDAPGKLQAPDGGWYDTGDIVTVDKAGYVTICGRAKRFAKIAGEMVSLSLVETTVKELWPEASHAVISVPDERKGEQLALYTEQQSASREAVIAYIKQQGLSEICIPRYLYVVDSLPVLASGKVDYVELKKRYME